MGIGSSGVANYANTRLALAIRTIALGNMGDFEVVSDDGVGLGLNFQTMTALDPRITFSRASNATLVGSNGLIQYAPHNLLTYSENFDNAVWVKTVSASVASNTVASPNGSITADTVTLAGAAQGIYQAVSGLTPQTAYTMSMYVKLGSMSASDYTFAVYDATNGGFINQDWPPDQPVSSSEWTRVVFNFGTTAGCTSVYIYPVRNTATVNGSVYIWGAQLNIASVAQEDYYTTSVKNLLGYSQNFENAAWTKSNSSVLYNLESYSQQFSNAFWDKAGGLVTVTDNFTTAPDGTTTATKWTEAAGTGSHHIHDLTGSYTPVIGQSYTMSMYLKQTETNPDRYVQMTFWLAGFAATAYANFDMQTGTVAFQGAAITNAVITNIGNGWYRLSVTSVATATGASGWQAAFISSGTAPRAESYTVTAGSEESYYLWGAQVVASITAETYTVTTSAPAPIQIMGPLGFVGAEKLVEDTATSPHSIQQTPIYQAGTIYTHSVYAKAGERSFLQIRTTSTSTFSASFDLVNGTYSQLAANTTASITPVGNGWFRCSITFTALASAAGATRLGVMLNDTTQSYTGDGTSGIYIFGAQLSNSASLDPYSYNFGAAPTSTAYYGPRFDYDPVTLAPKGLLIEEQRTNLLTYSEQFDNAAWIKTNSTIAANVIPSPDGLITADKHIANTGATLGTGAASSRCYQSAAITTGVPTIFSIYAKAGEYNSLQVSCVDSPSVSANFNLLTGTFSSVTSGATATITNVGNGWYRCSLGWTAVLTASIQFRWSSLDTVTSIGDGTSGIYIWGAQLEAGAFPTSYIPTTSASVTRAADNARMTGTNFSSWYNQSEGTIYSQWMLGGDNTSINVYNINDGTGINLIRNRYNAAGSTTDNGVIVGGSTQALLSTSNQITLYSSYKNAMAYKQDDFARSSSGLLVTDTLGNVPTVTQINIGCGASGTEQLNGWIQSIQYYPRRLANGDLQAITS